MATTKTRRLVDRLKQAFSSRSKEREESRQSVEWLKGRLNNFAPYSVKMSQKDAIKKIGTQKTPINKVAKVSADSPQVGSMYMFAYNAKHDDTLPFWDAFPLIILLGPAKKGFLGLNVHYLDPYNRAKFFDALLDVISTKQVVTDKSRLVLTYDLLKSVSRYKYFKPTIKHYLVSNVVSPTLYKVDPSEWGRVLFLRSAEWQKAGEKTVFAWSKSQIS